MIEPKRWNGWKGVLVSSYGVFCLHATYHGGSPPHNLVIIVIYVYLDSQHISSIAMQIIGLWQMLQEVLVKHTHPKLFSAKWRLGTHMHSKTRPEFPVTLYTGQRHHITYGDKRYKLYTSPLSIFCPPKNVCSTILKTHNRSYKREWNNDYAMKIFRQKVSDSALCRSLYFPPFFIEGDNPFKKIKNRCKHLDLLKCFIFLQSLHFSMSSYTFLSF